MRRMRPTTTVTALAAVLLTTLTGTAPAAAAGPDSVLYRGASLQRAVVPARTVTIDTVSTLPADRVELSIGGRVVGQDTTIDASGGRWVGAADVDLTGRTGTVVLRTKLFTGRRGLRVIDRFFQVVADVPVETRAPAPAPSPSPSPTPAPAPAPAPSPARPGPDSTGVPAGTALTPSGSLVVTTPGAVVEGLDITGCVVVAASDVTIRRSRIRCSAPPGDVAVRVASGARRLVVEDTEIDGLGTAQVGVGWGDYTLRRVDVHGVADGARFGHRVTIEDSWIHDMVRIGTLHPDALQTTSASNVVIRRNTLDPTRRADGNRQNAAIMLGSETGTRAVRNVLIEGNLLGGGNYSLNVRGDITAEGVVVRDNVFAPTARYGPVIAPARVPLSTGNVLLSGAAVPVQLTR